MHTYETVPIDVLLTLLISLSSAFCRIFIFVIQTYACIHLCTHFLPLLFFFSPLPFSSTFIAICTCIHVSTILYCSLTTRYSTYNASLCTCLYRLLPCSIVDAYTMRGNTIKMIWIHHEIYKETYKQYFVHQINTTCLYSIHNKCLKKQINKCYLKKEKTKNKK